MTWTAPFTFGNQSGNVPVSEIDTNFTYTAQSQQQQLPVYAVDTGSTNAYAVSLTPSPTLVDGSYISFKANSTNTGSCTLQVNGGTVYTIYDSFGVALKAGAIQSGASVSLLFNSSLNSSAGGWMLPWASSGTLNITSSAGGNLGTITGTGSPVENSFAIMSTQGASGTSLRLANSNTNIQASMRLGSGGGLDFYVGQAFGGSATSGTLGVSLTSTGSITVAQPVSLGYTTGAGGSVTQATSKGTLITLNKPVGLITTAGDALAANTTITWTWNNSVLGSNDLIVFTFSDGNGFAYNIWAFNIGAGSCNLALRNVSAGSRSEALPIKFAIIKGAVA